MKPGEQTKAKLVMKWYRRPNVYSYTLDNESLMILTKYLSKETID